jgi:4a-hydroxytetrahydrobiopterin dehydratase
MGQTAGWETRDGKLHRRFEFGDFLKAMIFVNQMAAIAEELQHHPDFSVHYNRVEVTLWTHDAGGITDLDHQLAERIGRLV